MQDKDSWSVDRLVIIGSKKTVYSCVEKLDLTPEYIVYRRCGTWTLCLLHLVTEVEGTRVSTAPLTHPTILYDCIWSFVGCHIISSIP